MLLSRTLRQFIPATAAATNSWSAGPLGAGLGLPCELSLELRARPDAVTGFICDIKRLDECLLTALRVLPHTHADWFGWLQHLAGEVLIRVPTGQAVRLRLQLSPHMDLLWQFTETPAMHYSEQFEFSAAHRLHTASLSDEENRRLFGKCNNPNGHGHNYVLNVTIALNPTDTLSPAPAEGIQRMGRLVREQVLDRYDHRHLNLDVAEFAALNPTVENITQVIWDALAAPAALGPALVAVRLYETAKTWAECRREDG